MIRDGKPSDVLMDTHVLLWLLDAPQNISSAAQKYLLDPEIKNWVGWGAFWETSIKLKKGALQMRLSIEDFMNWTEKEGIRILYPDSAALLALHNLPDIHQDPFDRLLVAQAQSRDWVLLSADSAVRRYPVNVVW